MWHGKGYLMYYRAMTLDKDDQSGADCVALSDDGVTWSKPKLGLVERAGRRDTNLIADDTGTVRFSWSGMTWLDTRPGVPETKRIKGFCDDSQNERTTHDKHTQNIRAAGGNRDGRRTLAGDSRRLGGESRGRSGDGQGRRRR